MRRVFAGIIGLAVDDGLDAAAEEGLEIAGCPAGQLMVAGIGRNSFSQGMFAAFFQGCSDGDEVFFRAFQGQDIRDFRTAFGDGTGLVHDDRVDGMGRFQGFAGFDEDTVFSPFASADHDGDWRSQAQGARAGDDQDGDGRREGEFGVDAHDEVPDEACNDGDGDDGRDEVARNGIGHLGDRCLAGTGFIDELDDLADRRVVADAAGCDVDETRLVYRSRRDFIADLFFYRDAFAGNGGFIDAGRPFRNDTVCRDAFTGADDDFIADDEVFDGNDPFRRRCAGPWPVSAPRSINFSMAVLVLPLARASRYLPMSMRVTIIPADSKYRLVLYWATRAQSPWPMTPAHAENGEDAVQGSCHGTHADQAVHVRGALEEVAEAVDIILAVQVHNRQNQ